jgi:hypothetical protein
MAGDRNLLIRGDAVWDGLMTHEYLHTRQEFETAADMEWFLEGSAFYYTVGQKYGIISWMRRRKQAYRALLRGHRLRNVLSDSIVTHDPMN